MHLQSGRTYRDLVLIQAVPDKPALLFETDSDALAWLHGRDLPTWRVSVVVETKLLLEAPAPRLVADA